MVIVVDPSCMSPPPPDAVTVPSRTAVPPDFLSRKWPAVPDAAGFAPAGSAAVSTPPVEVKLPEMVIEHSKVPDAAVSGVAGFAPDRISMIAPEPMSVASAAPMAWAEAAATVSAMSHFLSVVVHNGAVLDEDGLDHLENRQMALDALAERQREFLERVAEQREEERRPWWKPRVERIPEEPPTWEQPPEVEPPEGWR